MRRIWSSQGILAVTLIGVACFLWIGAANAGAQSDGTANGTPAATPAMEHVVGIEYFRYAPDPIEIRAGETVTWVNHDAVPHTVTATKGETPQSETLGLGESYQQTFTTPGTFVYICLYHRQMHGTIVVITE
jgi:plastocyanin